MQPGRMVQRAVATCLPQSRRSTKAQLMPRAQWTGPALGTGGDAPVGSAQTQRELPQQSASMPGRLAPSAVRVA
eukprot:6416735-Alexandrium_andersonii.AAC.1